ncbi:OsmC family protein [Solirhodobacter olei]|uniref:OsmC family protein n=1 Tax=Solirhodobacter olei TaxID=2493082 RepID=UPI000FDBC3C4|nr:OsmC family protein [Solirhodobacter olei]
MEARIKWVEGRTFVGSSGSGHSIVLGSRNGDDPATPGPSPMELLLIGTGGCSSIDVVMILERGREPIEDCECIVTAERAETDPKVFTRIHMHFIVKGRGLAPAKVERAVQLSAEKYCSASIMMSKAAEVTHDFEVIDTSA